MESQEKKIAAAITVATDNYFAQCEARVPQFCKKHYKYPGVWKNNKHALGWDLIRMPFNLFWAPIYLIALLLSILCKHIGLKGLSKLFIRTPSGFTSKVQSSIQQLVNEELLKSPASKNESALLNAITTEIEKKIGLPNTATARDKFHEALEPIVWQSLQQYSLTRTASADITNTLLSTAAGALIFNKFTPGGLGLGLIFAGLYAKHSAKENFFLGETIGGWYYRLFPPAPDITTILGFSALVLALLAIFSAFSGLLTDPIQYYLGIHKKRLYKMLGHLRKDFKKQSDSSFHPKDPYIARIMELLDAIKTQL